MERKIGEIFEHNGEWYQCVEGLYCDNCAFVNDNCEDRERITLREKLAKQPVTGFCNFEKRNDRKSVIFKKLKKVGGTYMHNSIIVQKYRIRTVPVIMPNEPYMYFNAIDNTIEIEIKQTQEDMEEKKDNVYIVYKHISPTGKEYVGMTRNIKKRWEGNGCSYNKNKEFRNDIMKYGWDNFQHIIIKDGLSLNEASKLEDELIVDAMDRGVAYNIARGGIGGSHPAWNKGVPLSEEQKEKLSAANKGKKLSDETKRKIGEAGRGRVFSEETRRKIGDKNRGKKHSKEHTEKWVKSNRWRFRKIEIRKNQELIGVFDSIHGAVRQTGLTQGFIYGILKSPKGKHQGYTIIILD